MPHTKAQKKNFSYVIPQGSLQLSVQILLHLQKSLSAGAETRNLKSVLGHLIHHWPSMF
jgi:hypothetical protein